MKTRMELEVIEVDYSVSPGGVNYFEVYDREDSGYIMSLPIFESESLTDAVKFCYDLGQDFSVRTLAQYYSEMDANV